MKVFKKSVLISAILGLSVILMATSSKNKEVTTFTNKNVVLVNEEVSAISVAKWIQKAKKLDAIGSSSDPIYLVMNTPGGSIADGIDFIEALKGLKRPIATVTIFAASMGFQIVQNAGERLVLKNGVLMSHRARGSVCESCEFGGQSPSQTDSRYNFWLSRLNELDQQTADRTGGKQTLKSYQAAYATEMWKTGNQSVVDGYADKVTVAACDDSLNGVTSNTTNFMGMDVKYDLSDCPMITGPLNVSVSISTNKGPVTENEFFAKGGQFDPYCMTRTDSNKLCSLDTSLNAQKIAELKQRFRINYLAKQRQVVYMTVPAN